MTNAPTPAGMAERFEHGGCRVQDIAYTAFMLAKQPNDEDGGPTDWFNDTWPTIKALIAAQPSAGVVEALREALVYARAHVVVGSCSDRLQCLDQIDSALASVATHPAPVQPDSGGWIVSNAEDTKWRTWDDFGGSIWTDDREKATRYHRREDAELVHREDEAAWRITPYGKPDSGGVVESCQTQDSVDRVIGRRIAQQMRDKAKKLDRSDKPQMAADLRDEADAIDRLAALAPVAAEGGAGCAEPQVGRAVYERIEKLIGAAPGTSQARELEYLKHLTESVEELGGFDGPVSDLPPPGLVDHFKSMQRMATAYLMPEDYIDRDGKITLHGDYNNTDQWKQGQRGFRAEAFASDMIYMLDGPEERAALRTEPTGGGEGA